MNQEAFDLEEHIATKDVAKRTGTSSRMWDGYRCKGRGPTFVRISARCVRYRWGDVLDWLASKKSKNTSSILNNEDKNSSKANVEATNDETK